MTSTSDSGRCRAPAVSRLVALVGAVAMAAILIACNTTTSPSSASKSAEPQVIRSTSGQEPPTPQPPSSAGTPINIVIGQTVIAAELWDNAPARALIDRLPLTFDFSDLNAVEKIARLDPGLPMTAMPHGDDPAPRDIGWYAPSGDIGTIADQHNDFTATIELAT
jgi:hypothetical protein